MNALTMQQMEFLVQGQREAYNQRDLAKFCSHFHRDVVLINLTSNETLCKGMNEFTARYEHRFSSSPQLHCDVGIAVVLKSSVVIEEYVSGAAQLPEGVHLVAIYGFRDGLIDRVWFSF
jgi:hypothetical protein